MFFHEPCAGAACFIEVLEGTRQLDEDVAKLHIVRWILVTMCDCSMYGLSFCGWNYGWKHIITSVLDIEQLQTHHIRQFLPCRMMFLEYCHGSVSLV